MADSSQNGLELPTSNGTRLRTGRSQDSAVEEGTLAGVLKNAQQEGRTVVFIDESGLSERPHCCRTWAPRGQTPVLQYHFNWKTLSAMAGITWWNFYFRLFPGSIRRPQVVEFLSHLLRHIPGKLLIVWDGLRSHRGRLVGDFVRQQRGHRRNNRTACSHSCLDYFRLTWLFGKDQDAVVLENLALRQQIAVYKRKQKRPRLARRDRWFWIALSIAWKDWRERCASFIPTRWCAGSGSVSAGTGRTCRRISLAARPGLRHVPPLVRLSAPFHADRPLR
jgi:DDE superfamily endonuclease